MLENAGEPRDRGPGGVDVTTRAQDTMEHLLHLTGQEMARQDEQWGWPRPVEALIVLAKRRGDEVADEPDPQKRIAELVQVAAVALSWAQAIQEETSR